MGTCDSPRKEVVPLSAVSSVISGQSVYFRNACLTVSEQNRPKSAHIMYNAVKESQIAKK